MTLKHPHVYLTGTRHHYYAGATPQARVDRALVRAGLGQHVIGVLEGQSKRAPRAVVAWPRDLPGVVCLDLFEEALSRAGVRQPELEESGDVESPLCRVLLSRAAGETHVRAMPEAISLWDDPAFEGAVTDLNILIVDGEEPDAAPSARVRVVGIPILKPRWGDGVEDTDQAEGAMWELGARLRFDSRPYGATRKDPFDDMTRGDRYWDDGARPVVSRSFANLPFLKPVYFRVRRAEGEREKQVQDRYVFGLHRTDGIEGDDAYRLTRAELIYQHQGIKPLNLRFTFDAELTPKRSESLPGLLGPEPRAKRRRKKRRKDDAPLPGDIVTKAKGQLVWIKDLIVKTEAKADVVQALPWRGVNATSIYWLLPEDFRDERAARLSEIVEQGRRVRLDQTSGLDDDTITFELRDGWDVFASDLKELLQHLKFCRAWQKRYEDYYHRHRQELECYSRVVRPVIEGLADVEFTTRASTPGGFHQKKFSGVRDEGGHAETESKLRMLRMFTQRISHHVTKALAVFSKKRFRDVYWSKQFLGEDRVVRWGGHTDRHPDARGIKVSLPPEDYPYDDVLKLFLLADLSNNFFFLAGIDTSDIAKHRSALQERIKVFRDVVGPALAELLEKKQAEEGKDAAVSFLTSKLSSAKLFETLAGGGFAIFFYGTDRHRDLVADALGQGSAKSMWRLSDDEWGNVADRAIERAGVDKKLLPAVELVVGYLKFGVDVHKVVTADGWDVGRGLDTAEVVLSGAELSMKTVKLIKPAWFEPAAGAAKSGGDKVLGGVGHALKVLSILKDLFTIYKIVAKSLRGGLTDLDGYVFAVANIAATVIAFVAPVVGAVLGALLMFFQSLWAWFTISEMEAPIAWYCRTPYGRNIYYDYEEKLGALPTSNPGAMFVAAIDAMNRFFDKVLDAVEDKDQPKIQSALRTYFEQYAESCAGFYKLQVTVTDKPKILVFRVFDDGRRLTSETT